MLQKEFPILEFDTDTSAFILPSILKKPVEDMAERCVLCFFPGAMEKLLLQYPHKIVGNISAGTIKVPVYEVNYRGEKVALALAGFGAPVAARQIEELTALGCKKYIACGSCGVLQKDISLGHLIIPTIAVRDEGTSYHYVKPSREISVNERVVGLIEETCIEQNAPYIKAKTWTTDACYRETPAKIKQRKEEGCLSVEMEAAAYIAASLYNNVDFGQILYAGDNLGGEKWDGRSSSERKDIEAFVLKLTLDACIKM